MWWSVQFSRITFTSIILSSDPAQSAPTRLEINIVFLDTIRRFMGRRVNSDDVLGSEDVASEYNSSFETRDLSTLGPRAGFEAPIYMISFCCCLWFITCLLPSSRSVSFVCTPGHRDAGSHSAVVLLFVVRDWSHGRRWKPCCLRNTLVQRFSTCG